MSARWIVPALAGCILLFLVAPVVSVAVSSFSGGPIFVFPPAHFTLAWYGRIPSEYFSALLVSLEVGIGATGVAVIVGVPAGLALVRGYLPFSRALNSFCLTPLMIPTLVIGVAALQFANVIYDVFKLSLMESVLGLVLAHSAFTVPFVIRAVIAGQAQFDHDIEDAALSLGATPVRTFFTVTLPALAPSIASGAILAFLVSFDDVPVALFLGGGSATTLPVQIFNGTQFDLSPAILALSAIVSGGVLLSIAISGKIFGLDKFLGTGHT